MIKSQNCYHHPGRPVSVGDSSFIFNRSFDQWLVSSPVIAEMSGANMEEVKDKVPEVSLQDTEKRVDGENSAGEKDDSNKNDQSSMPSPQQEEEVIRKKYGGILPRKPPLISKDHERAFFDSADWALGKQGAQKPKGPLEALRPKLQPTPHQQTRSRRSAYAPSDEEEVVEGGNSSTDPSEDQSCTPDADAKNEKCP